MELVGGATPGVLRRCWSLCRARLAEVFAERKDHHKGIAATMPNGILGQDFAIQHLQVSCLAADLQRSWPPRSGCCHDQRTVSQLQRAKCHGRRSLLLAE